MLSYRRVTWNTYRMHRLGMSENRGHSWNFSMCYVHVHWENEVLKQSILVDIYFQTKPREDARARTQNYHPQLSLKFGGTNWISKIVASRKILQSP
jgi:hypothetical protein